MKPTSDVPLMMKELHAQEATTPRSRLHRKCASVLTSRRSAPGGVWGSDTTLLASPVNGSGAGYVPHTTPIPRSGFVHGREAEPAELAESGMADLKCATATSRHSFIAIARCNLTHITAARRII